MLLVTGCKGGTTKTLPSDQPSSTTTEAERIVQQVVDAWNKHDVNGALAAFDPNVQVYRFPEELLTNSRASLGAHWRELFSKEPNARVTISPRIVHGRFVIDHETGSGLRNSGSPTSVWIYEVKDQKIVRSWVFPQ
jgi:hypothetical protein